MHNYNYRPFEWIPLQNDAVKRAFMLVRGGNWEHTAVAIYTYLFTYRYQRLFQFIFNVFLFCFNYLKKGG